MGNWYDIMTFKRGRTHYIANSSNYNIDIQNTLGNGVPFNNPKAIVGSNGFVFNTESKLYNKHSISGQTLNIQRFRTPMIVHNETLAVQWIYSVGHTTITIPREWSISVEKVKMLILDLNVVTGRYAPSTGIGLPDFFEPDVNIFQNNGIVKTYTSRGQWDWYSSNPTYNVYKSGDIAYEETRSARYIIETSGDLYGNTYKISMIPLELNSLIGQGRDTLLKLYSCTYFMNLFVYITIYYEDYDKDLGSTSTAYVFEG